MPDHHAIEMHPEEDTRTFARRLGERVAQQGRTIEVMRKTQEAQMDNHKEVMGALQAVSVTSAESATASIYTKDAIDSLKRQDSALFKRVKAVEDDQANVLRSKLSNMNKVVIAALSAAAAGAATLIVNKLFGIF